MSPSTTTSFASSASRCGNLPANPSRTGRISIWMSAKRAVFESSVGAFFNGRLNYTVNIYTPSRRLPANRPFRALAFLKAKTLYLFPSGLNLDLRRFISDNFRDTFVVAYFPGHANVLVAVRLFRIAELRAVTPPDQHRENLVGVWLIEIDERGISATPCCVMRAGYLPANSCLFPNVILGLRC